MSFVANVVDLFVLPYFLLLIFGEIVTVVLKDLLTIYGHVLLIPKHFFSFC